MGRSMYFVTDLFKSEGYPTGGNRTISYLTLQTMGYVPNNNNMYTPGGLVLRRYR